MANTSNNVVRGAGFLRSENPALWDVVSRVDQERFHIQTNNYFLFQNNVCDFDGDDLNVYTNVAPKVPQPWLRNIREPPEYTETFFPFRCCYCRSNLELTCCSCHRIAYCSELCRKADWNRHRGYCTNA